MCQSAASQKYCSWGHFLPVRSQLNWGRPNRETPVYFKVNINWKTKGNKKKKQKVKNRRNCLSKRSDQDDMRGFTLAPCFLPPACAWVVRSQEYFKAKLSLLPPPSSPVKRKKTIFSFFSGLCLSNRRKPWNIVSTKLEREEEKRNNKLLCVCASRCAKFRNCLKIPRGRRRRTDGIVAAS